MQVLAAGHAKAISPKELLGNSNPEGPVTEVQEVGLFTAEEMQAAFSAVGLTAAFDARGPGRGVYVASAPA